ncbi:MAG: aromatic hydrocarbon degradation protein [Desulfobacteraceae bacterium]|nr:MAG: aromatic hydrocarbon degradation protein [Desulfobacteraceae bacterium]
MRLLNLRRLAFLAVFISFVSCTASIVYGSGYGIFVQGASALGQADAVVAHSDGPSSVYFNPALINDLPGTQVELGTTLVYPVREFESGASGLAEESVDNFYFPSTFYLTHSFSDKIGLGLGVFSPFGLGTEWPDDWEGRTIATKSTITTFNFNPALSFRVHPRISLAAGLDFLYFDAELKRKIIVNPALPEIEQTFSGDDTGVGFNLGLSIKISDRISFGASYRSRIEIEVDGSAEFDIPPMLSAAVPGIEGIFPNTGAHTELTLPQQVFAGISARVTDDFVAEVAFRWEDWSSTEEIRFRLDRPIALPPQSVEVQERDWHGTFAFMLGGKYRINETFTLLGGYLYGQDAVPDRTFEPAVPDSPSHLFTAGADIEFDAFKIALSYGYQLQEDRDKETNFWGSAADGAYEGQIHLAALSLTYRF